MPHIFCKSVSVPKQTFLEDAEKRYLEVVNLGSDPSQTSREVDIPVGLKVSPSTLPLLCSMLTTGPQNLGATCYANASLQVPR